MAVSPTSREGQLSISVVPGPGEVAVVLVGELDAGSVDHLDHEVRGLRAGGFRDIVLDLRRLAFIDSTGLRVLLSLRNDAKRDARTLTLVPGGPQVQRTFELTRTRGLFDWRDV